MIQFWDLVLWTNKRKWIDKVLNCKQSETVGLVQTLQIILNTCIITANNDLEDMLVNGQLGNVKHISSDT